jgi:hypothetical protein
MNVLDVTAAFACVVYAALLMRPGSPRATGMRRFVEIVVGFAAASPLVYAAVRLCLR